MECRTCCQGAGAEEQAGSPRVTTQARAPSPPSSLNPQAAHLRRRADARAAGTNVAGVIARGDARASVSETEQELPPLTVPEVQPDAEESLFPPVFGAHQCLLWGDSNRSGLARSPGNVVCGLLAPGTQERF